MADNTILRYTTAEWEANNYILEPNAIGIASDIRNGVEVDTGLFKIGNGINGWLTLPVATGSMPINAQTGTTYTLTALDNGGTVTCDNGSAVTVTVPAGLAEGFNCIVVQLGAGTVSFAASGTTLNSAGALVDISAQYASATVLSTSSNVFVLGGSLA